MRIRALSSLLLLFGCAHAAPPLPQAASAATAARGEYLVRNVGVCGGCHSADEKDPDGALSGGRQFRDWRIGVAQASNLTPDDATGLGTWSEAEIVRAIRTGVRKDGRLLAPVMPYVWLSDMSDDDAFSIARYLKSLPPAHNEVRQSPNLIFKIGRALMLRPARSVPAEPQRGPTAAYGAYLSQHAGLCAECHTPRGGIRDEADRSRLFAGVPHPPKGFPAAPSNLTPDPATGIGRWSEADFIRTIRTGVDPGGNKLNPFMPWRQNYRMTDDDLLAIDRFLRTLPPIHNLVPRKKE